MKLYICGTTQGTAAEYAKEAMAFIRERAHTCHDWFAVYEEVIKGDLRRPDALAANKRALEESEGVILVLPCRVNGAAEAAYAAALGLPVVAWQAAPYDTVEFEQALQLMGNWSHGNLETCLGWLRQRAECLKRGKAQGEAGIQAALDADKARGDY